METVTVLIFLASKIIADGNFSHMIRRHLLFGRKAIRNLDSVLKSRDITLPAKVRLVKAVFFSQHSCTDVRFGPQRKLSAEELMLSKCGAEDDL